MLAFAETIQLFPDGTLFIHVGLILIMIWVLNRTLYRPINKIIEARDKSKGGHSSEAEGILSDVQDKEGRYSSEMLDTRSKGYEMIEKEQKSANELREAELAKVKGEVASKLETGKADIRKQADEAHQAIAANAEKVADSIAASILKG